MSGKNEPEDRTEVLKQTVVVPRAELDTDDIGTQIQRHNLKPRMVGRLVVVDGPGKGEAVPLYAGTNSIGRNAKNRVVLGFGDETISRQGHALITYDPATQAFELFDGGKTNPTKLNREIVIGHRPLTPGDLLTIGITTLRLEAS